MTARLEDDNGYILIENNPITREGVFEYLAKGVDSEIPPDKIVKVYRPREEIEDPDCINSFKLIPLIDDHEMLGPTADGFADASEYGTHGTTGEAVATRDGVMYATLKLFSEKIANALKQGKKDLSLGYRCVYEKAKGTFAGESYDYIQRQLRGNHLALVDEARCAVSVLDQKITYDSIDIPSRKDKSMDKEKEGKDELTLETVAEAVAKLAEKVDALSEKVGMEAETEKKDNEEESADTDAEKEAAKDADTEKEGEGKDADGEEKDDKTSPGNNAGGALAAGLDSRLKKLEAKALDSGALVKQAMKEIGERDKLAEQLSHHVGTFDASEKTLAEVAAYGVKKLGLDAKKGEEQAVLSGYLAGATIHKPQASAMDSKRSGKPSIVDNYISGK